VFAWLKNLWPRARAGNVGEPGEALAAEWLRRERDFVILARNWRNPRDRREEIDLVARDGTTLVFVEVKTRSAAALVQGYHAVDARKKKVLLQAAGAYLARLPEKPSTHRFDIVEVEVPAEGLARAEVRHFENVPLFPKRYRY